MSRLKYVSQPHILVYMLNIARCRTCPEAELAPVSPGVSTQLQSSGLVAHENSTFRNLVLAVSGPFMAKMDALFDFKCTCDSTLVYVCQADAEKCIFVWTILSQTPQRTPQVTYDAGRISARIF